MLRSLAVGVAACAVCVTIDSLLVPEPFEPWGLRYFRAMAHHPVRTAIGVAALWRSLVR